MKKSALAFFALTSTAVAFAGTTHVVTIEKGKLGDIGPIQYDINELIQSYTILNPQHLKKIVDVTNDPTSSGSVTVSGCGNLGPQEVLQGQDLECITTLSLTWTSTTPIDSATDISGFFQTKDICFAGSCEERPAATLNGKVIGSN